MNSISLLQVDDKGIEKLIAAKENTKTLCGGFMDVSQAWKDNNKSAKLFLQHYAQPSKKTFSAARFVRDDKNEVIVNQLLGQINPQRMWDDLTILSAMRDRYANSDNGVNAANWFKQQIEKIAKENNRDDVSITMIPTGGYKQPSVVVKVGRSTGPGIVVGAHMDTLSSFLTNKPGADDDGSGSVTVLETARVILSSGLKFEKPIYFIWYAAEEEGLVGSSYVVSYFKKNKIPVTAVLHFDMTGYAYHNEPTMWIIDDYVDQEFSGFIKALIDKYVHKPVQYTQCGYACSDHASWTQGGYVSAMPAEAAFEHTNPDLHSARDTQANLSLDHMTDYLKLGVAFVGEVA